MGALFSLRGHVLDTRRTVHRSGPHASREAAERAAGVAEVVAELLRAPSGRIEVSVDGAPIGEAEDGVFLAPRGELRLGERRFHGRMYVVPGPEGGLAVVNSVDAETLLQGLVPAEIFASAPEAALEAQAIVARGAMFSMLGHRHFDAPFHLCDRQHCQVYAGAQAAHPRTDAAVASTRGQFAVHPGSREAALHLVASVYSASCGGHTEANEVVWSQPASDRLRPRLDGPGADPLLAPFAAGITEANVAQWVSSAPPTYCGRASLGGADRFRWVRTWTGQDLVRLEAQLGVGRLRALRILGRGRSGRATGVEVIGDRGQRRIQRELPVRRAFENLRSAAFTVQTDLDEAGRLHTLTLRGAGFGHGVGMCQMGAIGRAEAGQSAAEILGFYYGGAQVKTLY